MKSASGEKILGVIRAHLCVLIAHLVGYAFFIILPCFFIFPLFHRGMIGILFFCAMVLIGIFGSWRALHLWDATVLIMTDQRLVHSVQSGLWNRNVSEVAFSHVGDVQWERRGLWQSLWSIGTLRVRTSGGSVPSIMMTYLPRPERLAQTIQDLRSHKVPPGEGATNHSLDVRRERMMHAMKQATEEELIRLEHVLDQKK